MKRYDFRDTEFGDPAYMAEAAEGEFAKFSDVQAEIERLRAVCKDAAETIRLFGNRFDEQRQESYMVAEMREAMEALEKASSDEPPAQSRGV